MAKKDKNVKVSIIGASGYTGGELIRLLANHRYVSIRHLTAEKHAGKKLSEVFPNFRNAIDTDLVRLDTSSIPDDIDFAFVALPHGKSAPVVKELYERGVRVVDLGADFRLDYDTYKKWYGNHSYPELIEETIYGLSELFYEQIASAKIVANPGCYPTSVVLAMAPLLSAGVVYPDSIIVDSKSGVTGAGRSPSLDMHFCEVNEGIRAYKVGEHRHTPEIVKVLRDVCRDVCKEPVSVHFTPHLVPMNRGILSTIYLTLKEEKSTSQILDIMKSFYSSSLFVRICKEGEFPSTSSVRGSNFCDIGVKAFPDRKSLIVISAIDNLVKGASGQAIQNMNIMMGFPEDEGLKGLPVFP